MAVRGIPTGKATPLNLQASLIDFLTGSQATGYPASAAFLAPNTQTLLALYPNLEVATPGVDNLDDLFRRGKGPLLIFDEPAASDYERYFGGEEENQTFAVQLVLLCRVFTTVASVSQAAAQIVNVPATRAQLSNAVNYLARLLRYHGGQFPIYDHGLASPYAGGIIGYAEVTLAARPMPQPEQGRCLFQLRVLWDTGTDG